MSLLSTSHLEVSAHREVDTALTHLADEQLRLSSAIKLESQQTSCSERECSFEEYRPWSLTGTMLKSQPHPEYL